jgi:hypothetical protein
MNQQPDKLFKEKLYNHSKPVSANAWNRVESRLDKKNSKGLWLKIAAALLILAVATFILWPANQSNENQPVASNKLKEMKSPPVVAPSGTKQSIQKDSLPDAALINPVATVKKDKGGRKHPGQKNVSKKITVPSPPLLEENIVVADNNEVKKNTPVITDQLPEINTDTQIKNTVSQDEAITLVYSAKEVNEKYLDKKSLAQATSEDKKPSTLRKLLDKAYDLKHNQDPFGDLRQKKNEILALNFKNEKQRSQNK